MQASATCLRRLARWLLSRRGPGRARYGPAPLATQRPAEGYAAWHCPRFDTVPTRYGRNLIRALRRAPNGLGRAQRFDVIRSPFVYKKTREQFALIPWVGRFGCRLGGSERAHVIRTLGAARLPGELQLHLRN
jgi:hypothetical protein